MKQCDIIAVTMGIMHNVLWVYIFNFDGILCFLAKLCTFKAKGVLRTWISWRRMDPLSKTKCDLTYGE